MQRFGLDDAEKVLFVAAIEMLRLRLLSSSAQEGVAGGGAGGVGMSRPASPSAAAETLVFGGAE